jgi:hypothetical protein
MSEGESVVYLRLYPRMILVTSQILMWGVIGRLTCSLDCLQLSAYKSSYMFLMSHEMYVIKQQGKIICGDSEIPAIYKQLFYVDVRRFHLSQCL